MATALVRFISLWHLLFLGGMVGIPPAMGQIITGRVVGVNDGDSLTLLIQGNQQFKVRLDGIDVT